MIIRCSRDQLLHADTNRLDLLPAVGVETVPWRDPLRIIVQ